MSFWVGIGTLQPCHVVCRNQHIGFWCNRIGHHCHHVFVCLSNRAKNKEPATRAKNVVESNDRFWNFDAISSHSKYDQ